MSKYDGILTIGCLTISLILGLSAMAIPTAPDAFQRAKNDREIKLKLLEARALPGSYLCEVQTISDGIIYGVTWKDENGEPFRASMILHNWGGERPVGHGPAGDFVPVANWYEVGE